MSETDAAPEPLISPRGLAEHTGVPLKTIYRWQAQGTGPRSIRLGKHLRFRPVDVASWLEARAQASSGANHPGAA